MPTITTGIRPIFTFADPGLIEYEKIAARRLGDILERLELGEGANLQLESSTFLPDDKARISFKVMEGILEPIILIDIDRQDPTESQAKDEQDIDLNQEETRFYYSPSVWIGATTVLHTMNTIGNNQNCDFFGFPPQAQIWGFEPEGINEGEGTDGEEYGYNHTVEFKPGLTSICGLPSWQFGKDGQPGFDINRQLRIFNTTSYEHGQGLLDAGFFGDQSFAQIEAIVRCQSGMTAFEGPGCYATTPIDALRPWGQTGQVGGIIEADEQLAENYWLRSVLVAGSYSFGSQAEDSENVVRNDIIPCIVTGEHPGGATNGVTITTEMPTGTIFNTVLPGTYEFGILAHALECECADSEVRVRMVLGERVQEIEDLNGETTAINYEAIVTVVDFTPDEIGDAFTCQQEICRDYSLGGHGLCDEFGDRGSLDSNGRGIWKSALFVNPFAGSWSLDEPTFRAPFFDAGPSVCAQGTTGLPDDPNCQSCDSELYQAAPGGFGHQNSGYDCIHASLGGPSVSNTRLGVGFHFARVVGVEEPQGRICHVQVVGNDGGAGECGGGFPSYSYGNVFFASGIDPGIPIGTNLIDSGLPTLGGGTFGVPGEIGGWSLGQLVVVVGINGLCVPGECRHLGSHRLIVSTPNAGGEDFRLLYWSQFRCPDGIGFENFIRNIEGQSSIAVGCDPTQAAPPRLEYGLVDGTGGFAPA